MNELVRFLYDNLWHNKSVIHQITFQTLTFLHSSETAMLNKLLSFILYASYAEPLQLESLNWTSVLLQIHKGLSSFSEVNMKTDTFPLSIIFCDGIVRYLLCFLNRKYNECSVY